MSPKQLVMGLTKLMWGQPPSAVLAGKARQLARAPQLLFVAILAATALASFAQKPAMKLAEDLPPGPMQAKATTSCLECHEARIILQQRLSKAAWTKEVDKMTKWGAVVEPADRDALIDYLSTNFTPDQPAYEPSRTANEKATNGKGTASGRK